MTLEQTKAVCDAAMGYDKTFGEGAGCSLTHIKDFQIGAKEVLNNPGKYGLMPIPTIQEVEDWLTTEKDLSPEEVINWTGGVVYDLLTDAFEHFKNRKA